MIDDAGIGLANQDAGSARLKCNAGVIYHIDLTTKDRKSTRLNSSHQIISYAVFCLKKKTEKTLLTGFTQMIGISLYMTQQQVEMSGQELDTRTDTDEMGKVLYVMLAVTTTFDKALL